MMSRHKLRIKLVCIVAVATVLGCEPAKDDLLGEAPAASPAGTHALTAVGGAAASAQSADGSPGEPPRMVAEAGRDLFAGKGWNVAPPPAPPPKPVAPPFPYVFSGSMRDASDAGEVLLFIAEGDRNFIVRKGETVGGAYRLDDITENEAVFTYLPLREKQTLAIGNTQ